MGFLTPQISYDTMRTFGKSGALHPLLYSLYICTMSRLVKWGSDRIQRMTFRLADREPIRFLVASYRRRLLEPLLDMHYQLECGIVLQGRMRRFYEGYQADYIPGDVWLSGIWEPHGVQIMRPPCECIVLVINPAFLTELHYAEAPDVNLMAPFLGPPDRRPGRGDARIEMLRIARQIRKAAAMPDPARQLFLRLRVQELLLTLLQTKAVPLGATPPAVGSYSRINPVVEMVFAARCHLSAQVAAKSCGLSRNRFSDLFRRMMGISFPEFALRHRVSGAAKQLLGSGDPLKAVAQDWGFTDASHLHRSFVKYYGCSVSEYRHLASGDGN